MSKPMPTSITEWDELCPPYWPEVLRQLFRPKKKWPIGPLPDPWNDYDQLYLTLTVHQLSSLIQDKTLADGIQELTGRSLKQQIGQIR